MGGVVGGSVGVVGEVKFGVVVEIETPALSEDRAVSLPSGANGFGLPSVPSGVRVMLCVPSKLVKATSERIVSSSFIFLTERSKVKKS